jgi:hypothetical protein
MKLKIFAYKPNQNIMQRFILAIISCSTLTNCFSIESNSPKGIPLPLVIVADGGVVIESVNLDRIPSTTSTQTGGILVQFNLLRLSALNTHLKLWAESLTAILIFVQEESVLQEI